MSEKWKAVVGWVGFYEVSDRGRVRSVRREVPHGELGSIVLRGRIMRQGTNGRGYRQVWLCREAQYAPKLVHRLVLEAFVGPCPEGMEACHNNGKREDNRRANLRWGTRSSNQADKRLHGTHQDGERSHRAKLTTRQVIAARKRYVPGDPIDGCSAMAREFGVSDTTISRAIRGVRWARLEVCT